MKRSKVAPQSSPIASSAHPWAHRRRLGWLLLLLAGAVVLWVRAPLLHYWLSRRPLESLAVYSTGHPSDTGAAMLLGERYLQARRAAEAERVLLGVIRAHPANGRAWLLMSQAEFEQGKLAESYASLKVAMPLFSRHDWAEGHWRMGLLLERSDQEARAEAEFRRALEVDPYQVGARLELARIALSHLHYGEALKHLEVVLRREPGNSDALEGLALAYRGLGDLDRAERYAREEVRLAPRSAGSWRVLGQVLQDRATPQAFAEAEQAYRRALQLAPDSSELHQRLGMIAFSQGAYPRAATELQRAIDLHPLNRQAYPTLIQCYRRLGQADRAERLTAEYRKIDVMDLSTAPLEYQVWAMPQNTSVRMRLARLYVRYHRPDLARVQVERVLDLNPDHPEARRLRERLKKQKRG